jgi:glutathione S-transferase
VVATRLELVSEHFNEPYLFGPSFTVADAYLFVMLRWAKTFGVRMAPELLGYFDRVVERGLVRRALAEGRCDLGAVQRSIFGRKDRQAKFRPRIDLFSRNFSS